LGCELNTSKANDLTPNPTPTDMESLPLLRKLLTICLIYVFTGKSPSPLERGLE
jgi:hypothetical protein